jgi:hypothetical protein
MSKMSAKLLVGRRIVTGYTQAFRKPYQDD